MPTEAQRLDSVPGKSTPICAALTDCEAAVSVNDGVFFISSDTGWTSMREARSVANAAPPGHYAAVFRWNT